MTRCFGLFALALSVCFTCGRVSADPVVIDVLDRIGLSPIESYTWGLEGSQIIDQQWPGTFRHRRAGTRWIQPVDATADAASFIVFATEADASAGDLAASSLRLRFYEGYDAFASRATFSNGNRSFNVAALSPVIEPWDARGPDSDWPAFIVTVDLSGVIPLVNLSAGVEYVMALSANDTKTWHVSYSNPPGAEVFDEEDVLGVLLNASFVHGPDLATQAGADFPQYGSALTATADFKVPLDWDGQGDGVWTSTQHWTGGAEGAVPDALTDAFVFDDTVTVGGRRAAGALVVDGPNARVVVASGGDLEVTTAAQVFDGLLEVHGRLDVTTLQLAGGQAAVDGTVAARYVVLNGGEINHRGTLVSRDVQLFAGTMNVTGGGTVESGLLSIDDESGETARVAVSGGGSSWDCGAYGTLVGIFGRGSLSVDAGADVVADFGSIGFGENSEGDVTLDDPGSTWTLTNRLIVGEAGRGTLSISAGAELASAEGFIGFADAAEGTVTVSGANSSWANAGPLVVGDGAWGRMFIEHGAVVANTWASVGFFDSSDGGVLVSGANSTWDNSDGLLIGEAGRGTLVVENRGTVSAAWTALGFENTGDGQVAVTGTGSRLDAGEFLLIGGDGGQATGNGVLGMGNGGRITVTDTMIVHGNGTVIWGLGDGADARITVPNAEIEPGSTLALDVVGVSAPGNSTHTVIAASEIHGTFTNVPPPFTGVGPTGHVAYGVFNRGLRYLEGQPGTVTRVEVDLHTAGGGDGNGDGNVDGQDITTLINKFSRPGDAANRTWVDNDTAGGTLGRGDGNVDGQDITNLISNFTGDAGPSGSEGTASAQYDPATGEFTLTADGVMNWTLISDGRFRSAPDAHHPPLATHHSPRLFTSANANTIGQGTFDGPFGHVELALGSIVEPGDDVAHFSLQYISRYGGPVQYGPITVVPEPGALALLLVGGGILLLLRRRRRGTSW